MYILATLYTVGGGGGQISQVITPGDGTGLTTVTVDSQDASRFAYYPTVQSNDNNQGEWDLIYCLSGGIGL